MAARFLIFLLLLFFSVSPVALAGEWTERTVGDERRTLNVEQRAGKRERGRLREECGTRDWERGTGKTEQEGLDEGRWRGGEEYTAFSFSPVNRRLDEGEGMWVWELRAGTWIADWDFTAKTAEKSSEISGKALGFIGPALDLRFNDRFSIEAAYQYNMGGDISAHVVSAGVAYKLFPPGSMDERYERLTVDFGVCYGMLDVGISDFPGDFDNGVGFYGGVQYIVELGERFELNVGIQARSLKFDFNPDDDVTEYNTSIGGLGGVASFHLLGIAYKF